MVTGASCKMRENKAKRLDDGAKGNARKAETDEVGVLREMLVRNDKQ
jgi:hypothetical protein